MPEKVLWNVLKNRQVAGLKFRREFSIGPYFGDFACPEAGLIVELDGQSHEGQQKRDAERTEYLQSRGYRVFRVTNDDVLDDVEVVAIAIAREAGVDVVDWLNGRVSEPRNGSCGESKRQSEAPHPNPLPAKPGRGDKAEDENKNEDEGKSKDEDMTASPLRGDTR